VRKTLIRSLFIVPLFWFPNVQGQEPALVSVDAVVEQRFTQTVPILGRLVAKRSSTVATRISGAISEVLVDLGDQVTQGQPLALIDSATLELRKQHANSQLNESRTRLKTAKALLALSSQEVKRLEGLQGSAAVSQALYDDARQQQNIAYARVSEAEAGISSSKASFDIAELELSYASISAPFDGTITGKLTEVGSYLQAGQAVFQIISDRKLELEADVPAALLGGLSKDLAVVVELENRSQHKAWLRAIIPEENPRTRTRRVRFDTKLNDDAGILASEQSATVLVPASAARNILTVHKDGVIRQGQNNIVYVATNDAAEMRVIETGLAVGERVEILAGLVVGDLVVVRGNERLFPGQPILVPENQ
jgi:RND family efflux transporter MFP subunit